MLQIIVIKNSSFEVHYSFNKENKADRAVVGEKLKLFS